MRWLLLIVPGGLAVPATVFLFARNRVEQHADRYAAAVRSALAARPTTERPKELTR